MKRLLLFGFIICFSVRSLGQGADAGRLCSFEKMNRMQHAKATVANPAEDEYDMRHVKLNLALTNMSTTLAGDVTTTARVVVASMAAYVFELNSLLTIDSILINGQLRTFTSSGYVRTVNLPSPLPLNSVFTVRVFYHGNPGNTSSFQGLGIRNQQSQLWGARVTWTLSESYGAKDWWPTKQSLTDKLDSADVWLTIPDTLKAGSNGLLVNITNLPGNPTQPGNKARYEWKTTYPIDYYLISVAVGPYVEYSSYVHFPNSTDSMLYQNYVYTNPSTLPFWKPQIDSVQDMITYFSQLYGRYPFWKEKYGHSMAPLSGGMENQTMTTLGFFPTTLTAHELGHQWFGDNVTCGSWKDIWLNEGFASYTEYLYVQHFRSAAKAFNYMFDVHDDVLQDDTAGSVYVDDTTSEQRIFDGRLTYDKGSAVVHTLRFVFNNDSLFFHALRTYQSQFQYGTATTPDFKIVCQQITGKNLDTFFNQWIYGEGHPRYTATWNQVGNQVYVKLNQTTSNFTVPLFHTPLEIRLFSSTADTIVRVNNSLATQTFSFTWNKPMGGMQIDPNDWILDEAAPAIKDPTLSAYEIARSEVKVFPNPANSEWQVSGLKSETHLQLNDMNGRLLWHGQANSNIVVPAKELASGFYLLKVSNSDASFTVKLIKQ
jgi:aminopeptidase N